jgi:hypothetical protein
MTDLLKEVDNRDSRRMQPLPWVLCYHEPGKCIDVHSDHTRKHIMSFWGGDKRHPQNLEWCTAAQVAEHAKYTLHCVNLFPHILDTIDYIYRMEEMPEEAIKAIEAMMEHIYLSKEEMPPYAR